MPVTGSCIISSPPGTRISTLLFPQCFHFFAYVEAAGLWQGGWLVLFLGTFPLLASLKCVC